MDLTSPHVPYIIGAFVLAGSILVLLTIWTLVADRKARLELEKWKCDETEA